MAKQKKSILEDIIQDIYNATNFEDAKALFITRVDSSKIPVEWKFKMKHNVEEIERKYNSDKSKLQALQIYATNSMFDKKGMK